MENQHFQRENQLFLWKISIFNGKINDFFMGKSAMFNGDINYFDWAIFNSKTLNYQRVLVIVCYSYDQCMCMI